MAIYSQELTHVITNARKSHNLLSASQRPRKPVVSFKALKPRESKFEGLRTRRAEEIDTPAQVVRQTVYSTFLCFFVLLGPQSILFYWAFNGMPAHIGEVGSIFFTKSTYSNAYLFPNTLTDTLKNKFLPAIWLSLNPVKLTHKNHTHTKLKVPQISLGIKQQISKYLQATWLFFKVRPTKGLTKHKPIQPTGSNGTSHQEYAGD